MALVDEVTNRLSTQRLVELTNPDDARATTVHAARLALAAADARAEFERRTGVVYDETSAEHHAVGWKGAVAYLYEYRGLPRNELAAGALAEWRALLGAYARTKTGAMAAVLPSSSSELTPSDEAPDGRPRRPDFDRSHFAGLAPRSPRSGANNDED